MRRRKALNNDQRKRQQQRLVATRRVDDGQTKQGERREDVGRVGGWTPVGVGVVSSGDGKVAR